MRKWIHPQTDLKVKYFYNADEEVRILVLVGLAGTAGGGTASGDAPRLQAYRLRCSVDRFLIAWTLFGMPSTRETR